MRANRWICVGGLIVGLVYPLGLCAQSESDGSLSLIAAPESNRNVSGTASATVERPELDAGRVFKGERAHYEFTIKNLGSAPLQILRVRASCGCTTPTHDDRIEPGATGKISAELRTQSLSGKVQKTITVTTNDPERPTLQLKLLATVVDVIQVESIPANTLYPLPGRSLRQSFLMHVEPSDSLQINSVSCTAPFVRAQLHRREPASPHRQTYEVQLEVMPDAPFGRSEFAVVLGTDSRVNSSHIVELACEKGIVAPAQVSFASAAAKANGAVTKTCLLKTRDSTIDILSLETPGPYLTTTVTPLRDGASQLVRVTWDASVARGPGPHFLRIKTDSPDQRLLEIPIVFSFEEEQALARSRRSSADPRPVRTTAATARSFAASLLDVSQIRGRTLRGTVGEFSEHTLPVRVKSTEPLTITSASCSEPFVTAVVQRDAADPQAYQVTLSITPDAPFGRTAASLILQTDSPTAPRQIVPFYCEKGIIVTPERITFASARANAEGKVSQTCLLRTKQGPLNILDLRSSDPRVRATARPLPNGTHQILSVTYDGGGSPGVHQGTLEVETDDPDQPLLEIPFRYTSR